MKRDVLKLLQRFKTTGFKNGDLVITAAIHRVVNKDWGRQSGSHGMEVVTVWPECSVCSKAKRECVHTHIMQSVKRDKGGQNSIIRLKA